MPGICRKEPAKRWKNGKWENGKRVAQEKSKASQLLILSLTSILIPPEQSPRWQLKLCQSKMSNWRAHLHTHTNTHTRTRTHTWTLYKIVHKRATKGQNRAKNRSKSFREKLLVTINYMQQFKKRNVQKEKLERRNETKAERSRETKELTTRRPSEMAAK